MPDGNRASRGRGFTLIELVIVMTLIGVLAVNLGPKLFTQSVFSQRGYADELAAALRFTQKAAVSSGCAAELNVSSASYQAWQQAASGNACNAADATWATPVSGIDGVLIQGTAPSGTTATPTGIYRFDDQGRLSSSPGTPITIGTRTITLVAGTGLVQVQ